VTQSSLCAAQGFIVPGEHVDHIEPHHGNHALLFDPLNLELLCASCHNRVTVLFDQRGLRKP
jgi:5-methylcytosine-specific restriction endonuclease McrA